MSPMQTIYYSYLYILHWW